MGASGSEFISLPLFSFGDTESRWPHKPKGSSRKQPGLRTYGFVEPFFLALASEMTC